jgi:quercetin dioxygenase-like cupin family protein
MGVLMNEILENPVTGETMRILESTPQAFRVEYVLRPHGEIPGEHFHPGQEQRISILSGEMHLRIDGKHKIVRAGESAIIPAGTCHFQWNPCDSEAVVIEELHPAGRLHDFFKVLFRLAQNGKTDAKGFPSPLIAAALFAEFQDSFRLASLGPRLLFAMLAPISSVLGYRHEIRETLRDRGAA